MRWRDKEITVHFIVCGEFIKLIIPSFLEDLFHIHEFQKWLVGHEFSEHSWHFKRSLKRSPPEVSSSLPVVCCSVVDVIEHPVSIPDDSPRIVSLDATWASLTVGRFFISSSCLTSSMRWEYHLLWRNLYPKGQIQIQDQREIWKAGGWMDIEDGVN